MNILGLRTYIFVLLLLGLVGASAYLFRKPVVIVGVPREIVDVQTAADGMDGFNLLENGPTLPALSLQNEQGEAVSLSDYRGKVVLLNLWATWCPPCIAEMPSLHALHELYKDHGFVVVPVASGNQGREEPTAFLKKRGLTAFQTLYDPHDQYLRTFDMETLPLSFLIDRDGKMRGGVIGMANWQSEDAKTLVEAFLAEKN